MKKNSKLITTVTFVLLVKFGFAQQTTDLPAPLFSYFKPNTSLVDTTMNFSAYPKMFHQFNEDKLPIFCKNEYKWSKLSGVNVRMRLGSLDYVNMLENK